MPADSVVVTPAARTALVRERQRELYGVPLRTLVGRLTADYGVSQARLAEVIGISAAMLSQVMSARRTHLGDPVVHTRLMILDLRSGEVRGRPNQVEAILAEVARVRRPWPLTSPPNRPASDGRTDGGSAAEALRAVASPEQLAAAAALLNPEFPQLADVLRQAAEITPPDDPPDMS